MSVPGFFSHQMCSHCMPLPEKLGAEFWVAAVAIGIPVEARDTPQILVATLAASCFDHCAGMIRNHKKLFKVAACFHDTQLQGLLAWFFGNRPRLCPSICLACARAAPFSDFTWQGQGKQQLSRNPSPQVPTCPNINGCLCALWYLHHVSLSPSPPQNPSPQVPT